MALGSTEPITELSTRNFRVGKGWPAHKPDNLTVLNLGVCILLRVIDQVEGFSSNTTLSQ
jgi:hypothetical protein